MFGMSVTGEMGRDLGILFSSGLRRPVSLATLVVLS
jgi:hypothetical protein